ncbi:Na+/H+ antiporter subunit A [Bacillus marinisedimentorum]|uniref:Na+/H+ antiporter subunit A n=1 Tax=Bacillus marinisedimentorum TaxID=1821260 RepID=UPI000871EB00|nr:Na+/H+ antiporter subunit A [Bacillus marinisedimentorum]
MLHIAVLLPLLFAVFVPAIYRNVKRLHTGWFVLAIPVILFAYLITYLPKVWEKPLLFQQEWIPSLGINYNLYVDGLSLLFGLLITGIGSLVVLYSVYYLDEKEKLGHFYVYLLLFMTAMLGVVFSDNLFVLYTFWEFTSLSSFLLIGYWNHRERSRYGAQKSLVITVLGGLALLGGFILLAVMADSTSIRGIIANKDAVLASPYFTAALMLVLTGAFAKSAQFPFHTWLPDAMEAPTPVSAYLHSATMVKAGIYLVARISLIFAGTDLFFILVSGFGLLTLIWGSYMAVRQTDLKAILAYSTISQLGMIMSMLGFGTGTAVLAAIFHIFNHATFKGSLFMVAGIVDHETGTRDIRRLGGLMTFMPITATLAFFGTFSMAGVPLPVFNGFLSKEMFFDASLEVGHGAGSALVHSLAPVIPYLAVFGSIFTFVYSMLLFFGTFRGEAKLDQLEKSPHEPPLGMLISPIVLVTFVILIGIMPNLINEPLLAPAVAAVTGEIPHTHLAFWHGFNTPLYMSLTVLALGTLLYLSREKWAPLYNALPGRWSASKVYDSLLGGLFTGSRKLTGTYMTGSLYLYMAIILSFSAGLLAFTMWVTGGFSISFDDLAPVSWPQVLVGIVMIIAAVGTIVTTNRIAAILILGIVGYGLSLLFVFFRAPDLALTQLIVETVSVALFLLAFYHLPNLEKTNEKPGRKLLNAIIAISMGTMVTLVAIASHSTKMFDSIAEYFVETSVTLGGGHNIVNVILVDMRGLDTMLEITVLGLAALGIYGMIKLRGKGEEG